MRLTLAQLSPLPAALAELQSARFLCENIGQAQDGRRADPAARDEYARRTFQPLLARLWPFFDSIADAVADDAEEVGGADLATVRQLRRNRAVFEKAMVLGWEYSGTAGRAMDQTFRWAVSPRAGDAVPGLSGSAMYALRAAFDPSFQPPA